MLKGKEPGDELRVLITVLLFLASASVQHCAVQKKSIFAPDVPRLASRRIIVSHLVTATRPVGEVSH